MKASSDVPGLFLNTGEMVFATQPCLVKTILGSCVAVGLHDPRQGWGGLCHFLLAQDPDGDDPGLTGSSTRYGNVAIPSLVKKFLRRGSRIPDLEAIVVGGALLLDANEVFFVGERNVRFANKFLDDVGIPIVHRDIGGDVGRRLVFRTHDGAFAIEPIQPTEFTTVIP